jgi:hypothetical protein
MNEVGHDFNGTMKGLHLREKLYTQTKPRIRQNPN